MTQTKIRQEAIKLRQQGFTYSEIKRRLNIPKSTLSDWLSTLPLSEKQLQILKQKKISSRFLAIEKTRLTKRKKRENRLQMTYKNEEKRLLPLTKKQLEIAGLFLYWGEGAKNLQGAVSINNTDPQVLLFALYWLIYAMEIPKEKIKVFLHLYSDMDKDTETKFWSEKLKIPLSQFLNPYTKNTKRSGVDHKGHGHGTCTLVVYDVLLKERIIMGITSIADYYSHILQLML